MRAIGALFIANGLDRWLLRLGGPGLIVVGLIDNSIIPIPGSMDVFTILLTARHREWWVYYAGMSTLGAVAGGYITYRLAKKGGKAGLEKKLGKRRSERVYKKFEVGGFASVFLGSMMPPPFPLVPVLMAAGVMQFPAKRFLLAVGLGRAIRFLGLAFLGRIYGTAIIGWLTRYYQPFLYVLIGLAIAGSISALVYLKWYRPRHQHRSPARAWPPNSLW